MPVPALCSLYVETDGNPGDDPVHHRALCSTVGGAAKWYATAYTVISLWNLGFSFAFYSGNFECCKVLTKQKYIQG